MSWAPSLLRLMSIFDFFDEILDSATAAASSKDEHGLSEAVGVLQSTIDQANQATLGAVEARNRLIVEMHKLGKSQVEIANASGLAQTTISKVLRAGRS